MDYIRILHKRMCFTVALIALLVFSCHVSGQIDAPDKLKAAYILSFAKLVSWPPNILPTKQANLVICAAAAESLTNELRNHSGKTIQGHRVQVIALGKRSDSKGCHIVFIDTRHSSRWFKGANPIEGQLLVGEEEGFIDKGGVINFYIDGEKLRFEISVGHARQSRLDISSRLLNLAKIVGEDGQ